MVNTETVLHENTRYVVHTASVGYNQEEDAIYLSCVRDEQHFSSFYVVRNKETGVLEHICPQLPEAIATAEGLNDALEAKPWERMAEWRAKAAAEEAAALAAVAGTPVPLDG